MILQMSSQEQQEREHPITKTMFWLRQQFSDIGWIVSIIHITLFFILLLVLLIIISLEKNLKKKLKRPLNYTQRVVSDVISCNDKDNCKLQWPVNGRIYEDPFFQGNESGSIIIYVNPKYPDQYSKSSRDFKDAQKLHKYENILHDLKTSLLVIGLFIPITLLLALR